MSHLQASDLGGAGALGVQSLSGILRIKISDHCFLGVKRFRTEVKGLGVKAYIPRAVDDGAAAPAWLAGHPALAPESLGKGHLPGAATVHAGGRTSDLLEALSAPLEAEDQGWKSGHSSHTYPLATNLSVLPTSQLSPAKIPTSQHSWPR